MPQPFLPKAGSGKSENPTYCKTSHPLENQWADVFVTRALSALFPEGIQILSTYSLFAILLYFCELNVPSQSDGQNLFVIRA